MAKERWNRVPGARILTQILGSSMHSYKENYCVITQTNTYFPINNWCYILPNWGFTSKCWSDRICLFGCVEKGNMLQVVSFCVSCPSVLQDAGIISSFCSHSSCSGKKTRTQLQVRKALVTDKIYVQNGTEEWEDWGSEKGKENYAYNNLQNSSVGQDLRSDAYREKRICTNITAECDVCDTGERNRMTGFGSSTRQKHHWSGQRPWEGTLQLLLREESKQHRVISELETQDSNTDCLWVKLTVLSLGEKDYSVQSQCIQCLSKAISRKIIEKYPQRLL